MRTTSACRRPESASSPRPTPRARSSAGSRAGYSAARFGVKPTVVTGLLLMVATTAAFGFAESIVVLDLARFAQGFASALTWTASLAWLVSRAPTERRGLLIGTAMSAAIVGALFGPVLGGVASIVGIEVAFATVAAAGLGLAVWAALMPAVRPEKAQPLSTLWAAVRDRGVLGAVWFVALPALLFSTMGVLVPLRLDVLGMAPSRSAGCSWSRPRSRPWSTRSPAGSPTCAAAWCRSVRAWRLPP